MSSMIHVELECGGNARIDRQGDRFILVGWTNSGRFIKVIASALRLIEGRVAAGSKANLRRLASG